MDQSQKLKFLLRLLEAERIVDTQQDLLEEIEDMAPDMTLIELSKLLDQAHRYALQPEQVWDLDLSEKEKQGYESAFKNARAVKEEPPEHVYSVVYENLGGYGFTRIYCLADDPDMAVDISKNTLLAHDIETQKLTWVRKVTSGSIDCTTENASLVAEVIVSQTAPYEILISLPKSNNPS